MHREKISYLAEMYASQEDFIPCGIYASWEDFISRKILCIARRFNPLQKFTYRKKISYLQQFIHREKIQSLAKFAHRGKIFMPRKQSCNARKRIVHLKGNIYPSTSSNIKCQGEKLSVDTVEDTVSHLNYIFKLTSIISVFVKSIQEDEFSNQITGTDDIKRDAAQRGTFS